LISHQINKEQAVDFDAYLQRINYRGTLAPTAQTLRELQVANLLTVPFENLSIHANQPIVLEDEALFKKIVEHRRGGFCYELNGLFAALLRSLGFKVDMLSAQVATADGHFGPDFDHMVLLVKLEERWIADVGFGDSFLEPLLLDERTEQVQGARSYKIVTDNDHHILMQRGYDREWITQYRFTLQPYNYADYAAMCRYHQTSPQSHFTRSRVCTRATPEGRITLSELRFITTSRDGERQETALPDEAEYASLLRKRFGIVI
jgi:N-hydroxyarylamine O-acetyltransferase